VPAQIRAARNWVESRGKVAGKSELNLLTEIQATGVQPWALSTRSVEAGDFSSLFGGRRGRATNSPPQLGQCPCSTVSAQVLQKVHSKEQMRASVEPGGRSLSQHSQLGRS
jgi:hypothetical protein